MGIESLGILGTQQSDRGQSGRDVKRKCSINNASFFGKVKEHWRLRHAGKRQKTACCTGFARKMTIVARYPTTSQHRHAPNDIDSVTPISPPLRMIMNRRAP